METKLKIRRSASVVSGRGNSSVKKKTKGYGPVISSRGEGNQGRKGDLKKGDLNNMRDVQHGEIHGDPCSKPLRQEKPKNVYHPEWGWEG